MRKWLLFFCLLVATFAQAQSIRSEGDRAQEANDYIQALKEEREEAQDKLVNAYVTIMKLQRELDKLKADHAPAPAH
jgi:uncharacterized coiled-coil DUF342 family protein